MRDDERRAPQRRRQRPQSARRKWADALASGFPGRTTTIPGTVQTGAGLGLRGRLVQLRKSQLVRQNAILFAGGLTAGIGGFIFHAIAGRILGPTIYRPVAFLIAVYAVGTAPALILIVVFAFALGLWSVRAHFRDISDRVRLRVMAAFSLTAAAGIIGVQILYNQDVILAVHYLSGHDGGIYGGLNKIGTILYFLTLSVSQVLFPRVVEAVAKEQHPGRILLSSAGILTLLGAGVLFGFPVVHWL